MSLWVSVHRVERKPFLTLEDKHIINYHEIKDNFLTDYEGVQDLPEYPSTAEALQYIPRLPHENKVDHYDRALEELPSLKKKYEELSEIYNVSLEEKEYLENHSSLEELFFLKRCYELADSLKSHFAKEFEESDALPIVLNEEGLTSFNQMAQQKLEYDPSYIYKLHVG